LIAVRSSIDRHISSVVFGAKHVFGVEAEPLLKQAYVGQHGLMELKVTAINADFGCHYAVRHQC
jgi:hypothetical protein